MLTYSFDDAGNTPLYEYLYECIRQDILSGKLQAGEKLPSKRTLARNLGISTITVEGAYGQLVAEGYCQSRPRSGFFVAHVPQKITVIKHISSIRDDDKYNNNPNIDITSITWKADFVANSVQADQFPFALWTRLLRRIVMDKADAVLEKSPGNGILELRQAIAEHLQSFRGFSVSPEQIVIGAGTEYLYNLLVQFLGRDKVYCVENPGYERVRKIYNSCGANYVMANMDDHGIRPVELEKLGAQILHISPSHHFPTGIVTPINRRYELLGWAEGAEDRFIIEDDYDSEFRLSGKPIPTLTGIDVSGRVIYMNTFSKSLTPTIRISYMVLPHNLLAAFREKLGFYSCTVSNFEQYTMAAFIHGGHFEKHINRMLVYYRRKREFLLKLLKESPAAGKVEIIEHGSGLHFLLKIESIKDDTEFINNLASKGIRIKPLADYYEGEPINCQHIFVLNYTGVEEKAMKNAVDILAKCIHIE